MLGSGEIQLGDTEKRERLAESPRLLFFLSRHAEPAKRSIFDQLGLEKEPKSNNFEESSLTLSGILESHLLSEDVMESIAEQLPEGKLKVELLTTRAYRTKETVQIIMEGIQNKALALGKKIQIDASVVENLLLENRDEDPKKSASDLESLVDKLSAEAQEMEVPLVVIGVAHEAKMRNFLNEVGVQTDAVKTAGLIELREDRDGQRTVTFGDQSIQLEQKEA